MVGSSTCSASTPKCSRHSSTPDASLTDTASNMRSSRRHSFSLLREYSHASVPNDAAYAMRLMRQPSAKSRYAVRMSSKYCGRHTWSLPTTIASKSLSIIALYAENVIRLMFFRMNLSVCCLIIGNSLFCFCS